MRLTRALFFKFRKLDNINIILGEEVTILIGENNAGKSTLLEGINGAIFENSMQNTSKFFSKVSKKDALIRLFFKINVQDLDEVLLELNLEHRDEDNLLIHHEYELNCTYGYESKKIDKRIVTDKLKGKYHDHLRLGSI